MAHTQISRQQDAGQQGARQQLAGRRISRKQFLAGTGVSLLAFAAPMLGCSQQKQKGDAAKGSAAAKQKTKLTLCLDYTPNTNHTGLYVAKEKGFFADEGLELEFIQSSENSAEAMVGTGQAQVGVSYQDYVANALSQDNPFPVTAVAAIIQHNTSGIMSRAADGITSAKKMENHRYATWDMPVEQATIKQVVTSDGGDFSKITMVPYNVDDEVSGLKANMFDAVWVYEGWAYQNAKVQKYDVNYFSFSSMDPVFDFYTPVLIANNSFMEKSADQLKGFLRAVKKGYEFAISNPNDAASILLKAVPELDEKLVRASAQFLAKQYQADASSWGVIDAKRWSRYFTWLNDNKLVKHALDVNAGWTDKYLEKTK